MRCRARARRSPRARRPRHRGTPLSARSRCAWLRLPWMGAALMPARARRRQQPSARCLVRMNTITRSGPSRLRTFASRAFLASEDTGSTVLIHRVGSALRRRDLHARRVAHEVGYRTHGLVVRTWREEKQESGDRPAWPPRSCAYREGTPCRACDRPRQARAPAPRSGCSSPRR